MKRPWFLASVSGDGTNAEFGEGEDPRERSSMGAQGGVPVEGIGRALWERVCGPAAATERPRYILRFAEPYVPFFRCAEAAQFVGYADGDGWAVRCVGSACFATSVRWRRLGVLHS
jgi:hypothetical protein